MSLSHPALEHLPRGWFHHGAQVLALLEQHRPRVIVELGTHLGASAIAIARVVRTWGGMVYCVDTWSGVPHVHAAGKPPLRIFECATNLVAAGVGASVRLIPATTALAAKRWAGPLIDVLYVDADHTYEGCVADLVTWTPHVRAGGLLLGDDYAHPGYPGVRRAWEDFSAMHGLTLQLGDPHTTNPPGMRLVYTEWKA